MKQIINRLKNDPLFSNIIRIKTPIDRLTFLTIYLLRMLLLCCLYQILPSLVMLPVTYWFMFNLIDARLLDISNGLKRGKAAAAILAFFITIFIYMSLTIETMFIYHIPPKLMMGDFNTLLNSPILNTIVSTVNMVQVICGVFTLSVVIILSCIKGKKEADTAMKSKLSLFWAGLFQFRGSLSRVDFMLKNTFIGLLNLTAFFIIIFLIWISGANSLDDIPAGRMLLLIWTVLMLIMTAAVTARRLHDLKRSGWWTSVYFILVFLYVLFTPVLFHLIITNIISMYFGTEFYSIYNLYIFPALAQITCCIRFIGIAAVFYLYLYPGESDGKEEIIEDQVCETSMEV